MREKMEEKTMRKVAIFVDHENVRIPAEEQRLDINWYDFKEYLASESEGRALMEAFIYVVRDPRSPKPTDKLVKELWEDGWIVREKERVAVAPDAYKGNVDVEMTMEMVAFALDAKPDIVVLVSGDQDFVPVVLKLRERGIRVEVASFPNAVSHRLLNVCSGFINLDKRDEQKEKANEKKYDEKSLPCECALENHVAMSKDTVETEDDSEPKFSRISGGFDDDEPEQDDCFDEDNSHKEREYGRFGSIFRRRT